jgi:hypothetical protein
MQLNDALSQIAEIRALVERARVYRGYRSIPVALSGLLAVAAAIAQSWLLESPLNRPGLYVSLWVSAALLSVAAAGGEIITRYRRTLSETERARTRQAAGQFAPCLLAGGLLTAAILMAARESIPLLPGIWCVLFSLGIFASLRVLPRGIGLVAAFYLLCGLADVTFAQGAQALAPWTMAVPFGVGQLWAAGILYWKLERTPHA